MSARISHTVDAPVWEGLVKKQVKPARKRREEKENGGGGEFKRAELFVRKIPVRMSIALRTFAYPLPRKWC